MSETVIEDGRTSAKKAAEKEMQTRYNLSEDKKNERYKHQYLKSDSNSGDEDENEQSGERAAVRRHRRRRFQKKELHRSASRVDDMLRHVTNMNVKYIETTASTATSSSTIDSFDLEDTTRAFQLGAQ
jgi:hypothetical protein